MSKTILSLLDQGSETLKDAGVEQPRNEALLLLGHCLEKSRTELFLGGSELVSEQVCRHYFDFVARRASREPFAYITGRREFWSLDFGVCPSVLIPRPETEFLLEKLLAETRGSDIGSGLVLDLCCGSGVIAVVLARELGVNVIASDCSPAALTIARQNSVNHLGRGKVELVCGDLLDFMLPREQFSLIVSNPPYVKSSEVDFELQPEVAEYEPRLALDGGADGLDLIKMICAQLPQMLQPQGHFFMEIGADQGSAVSDLLMECRINGEKQFDLVRIYRDYSGRERVAHAVKIS
ncbi:MAG: peptide chain release factor N(5)-glutamine methyltransferase [Thermodesulfobacteriota bacterium]